ncbi:MULTISPECIES: universal stress protein [Nocardia]|uniref:Universal stress protein Rv1636/MT1672 n=1 Tax=Nocardia africana TaxID=134964 RepID=A0A378X7I2_9NOCA|nr:universal stress protein [Nocardia africana]MCC3317847.1 universal stress protein [Nocardia africana]SUA48621.1 Universal stress protein Rv1636/MT1672 [Nocardia africana]
MTAYRTIIVDTDGSDRSYRVVDHAAELAHATHARLLIICVRHDIDERALGSELDLLGSDAYRQRGSNPAESILRTAHQHALAHGATAIETHILPEPTLPALLRLAAAAAADLIVTANPHRSRLLARLLSTPPITLAREAHCDVLIAAPPLDTHRKRP